MTETATHLASLYALFCAALTPAESVVYDPDFSDSTQNWLACLDDLGVPLQVRGTTSVRVGEAVPVFPVKEMEIMDDPVLVRLLGGLSLLSGDPLLIHGGPKLRHHSFAKLFEVLEALGVGVEAENGEYLPVRLTRRRPITAGTIVALSPEAAREAGDALLLTAPALPFGLVLRPENNDLFQRVLLPCLTVMKTFGARVFEERDGLVAVSPGGYRPAVMTIPRMLATSLH